MIGFVFPGQGSQHTGMGKELFSQFSVAREVFEEANDALGINLERLCFEGPEEDLKLTANTQPAILTVSIAAHRVVTAETGLRPSIAAGHSLGEYSALVAAGAIRFAEAVKTVRQRGAFMQEAVPVGTGAMAAVMGLDSGELEIICREAAQGDVVAPANFNSPGQVVIAGQSGAVGRAITLAKNKGAKRAILLPVSAPFHCELMVPAARRLETVLKNISVSEMMFPVVSNVEAEPNEDPDRVKELLLRQVCAPVRWDESVQRMADFGVDRFFEIGPGKVLSGLIKRIVKDVEAHQVDGPTSLASLPTS